MPINVDYPNLLTLFLDHIAPGRSESASFLIWYLENYYRLDMLEAQDAVCDQRGDKGVDGIFVNDDDQTITIFQSTIRQNPNSTIGDASLREFAGTITQFATADSIMNLINSAGTARVANLAKDLDLVNKIATHDLRAEFLSNVEIDDNGRDFLRHCLAIIFIGKDLLISSYISDSRDLPTHAPRSFDIAGFSVTQYSADANTSAVIAPIKATELVALDGIADQSLFAFNVRGPLGRTQVNRDIVKSIQNKSLHRLFPLFHNGITVIASDVTMQPERLTVTGYHVVNGCQSLTALFNTRNSLTDDLRVLVKFIKTDPESSVAQNITEYSNNQNPTRARDFKANHPIQIRLQNEFKTKYPDQYVFEKKRGEDLGVGTRISNEEAGLYLRAFDLREPWATHRKYEVFDEKHADLFGRPDVTADRIVLCQIIAEEITNGLQTLENALFARYVLTKYFLMYVLRDLFDNDALSDEIQSNPARFVADPVARSHFRKCVKSVVTDIMINLNHEANDLGADFDYRDKLRDQAWVRELRRALVTDYKRQVVRKRIEPFSQEWAERMA
jgi:hypothetical protein